MKALIRQNPAPAALAMALESQLGWRQCSRVAFLRARPVEVLHQAEGRLDMEQTWKPHADELAGEGFASSPSPLEEWGAYDLVLVLPLRQRDQTLHDLARGMKLLKPGGALLAAIPNDWGAARHQKHLEELAGPVEVLTKYHCRAIWTEKGPALDEERMEQWLQAGRLATRQPGGFVTAPGLFSWEEIDPGSAMLTRHLPPGVGGRVAELGCGWGHLARHLLDTRPQIRDLHLYEADAVALEAARANLRESASSATVHYHWHDVTQGLGRNDFDWVITNPPFHTGRAADPALGHRFIAAGAMALRPGGHLCLVANQHLPYERFLSEALPETSPAVQEDGYKVLCGRRPKLARPDRHEADRP